MGPPKVGEGSMTDEAIVAAAVAEAQSILLEFLGCSEHDPEGTIDRRISTTAQSRR
jgi:hypothetical protein